MAEPPNIHSLTRRVVHAIPLLFMTAAYILAIATDRPILGYENAWLKKLFMLEFFAIHSFPFMMILLIWSPASDKVRGLRAFLVMGLLGMYGLGAYAMAEWGGVFALGPLMAGTYLGMMFKGIRRSVLPELITRGIVNFVLFILCASVFDLPTGVEEWEHQSETMWAGALYFGLLSSLEVHGTSERIAMRVRRTAGVVGNRDDVDRMLVPVTRAGIEQAVVPLAASFGLAVLPWILLPVIAGYGGRFIDAAVAWPASYDLIRWWFFLVFASGIGACRSWQVMLILKGRKGRRRIALLSAVWVLPVAASAADFLTADHVRFSDVWALSEVGILMFVDFVMLVPIIPSAWLTVDRSPHEPAKKGR